VIKFQLVTNPGWKVKVQVSHHVTEENGWKSTKPLVFVMDEQPVEGKKNQKKTKDEKKTKKKEKAPTFNLKNCGTLLDIGKVKGATSMTLAWRCRFFGFARFPNHIVSLCADTLN